MSLREEHFFLHAEQRNNRLERKTKRFSAFLHNRDCQAKSHYIVHVQYVCPTQQIRAHFHNIPFLFVNGLEFSGRLKFVDGLI
jgi:hypothetical protein